MKLLTFAALVFCTGHLCVFSQETSPPVTDVDSTKAPSTELDDPKVTEATSVPVANVPSQNEEKPDVQPPKTNSEEPKVDPVQNPVTEKPDEPKTDGPGVVNEENPNTQKDVNAENDPSKVDKATGEKPVKPSDEHPKGNPKIPMVGDGNPENKNAKEPGTPDDNENRVLVIPGNPFYPHPLDEGFNPYPFFVRRRWNIPSPLPPQGFPNIPRGYPPVPNGFPVWNPFDQLPGPMSTAGSDQSGISRTAPVGWVIIRNY